MHWLFESATHYYTDCKFAAKMLTVAFRSTATVEFSQRSDAAKLMLRFSEGEWLLLAEMQWLKWFCEAVGGSPDEARLEQTP